MLIWFVWNFETIRNTTNGFKVCDETAKVGSCREMTEVQSEVKDLINYFLEESHCVGSSKNGVGQMYGNALISMIIPNLINVILFVLTVNP